MLTEIYVLCFISYKQKFIPMVSSTLKNLSFYSYPTYVPEKLGQEFKNIALPTLHN